MVGTSTVATSAYLLRQPNVYTATATILPIERGSSGGLSSLLNSSGLGLIAAQAGLGGGGQSTRFVTILQTRTLAENLITKHNLKPVIFPEHWDAKEQTWKARGLFWNRSNKEPSLQAAVKGLSKIIEISADKKSEVISISATTTSAEDASMIANYYVEELNTYLVNNTLSTAKKNRVFVESQLDKAQIELSAYETNLKNFQQKNKIVSLDAQTQASIQAYSNLKSRLISAEVELKILEKSSFLDEPQIELKRQETNELKNQLTKLEATSSDSTISFKDAPAIGLSFARIKREILVREKVFELLTQQLEMAKIQEAQEDISFQVLDEAIPPERKSGPNRILSIVLAFIVSLAFSIFSSLTLEFWKRNKETLSTRP